jgi:hypothetical protein
MTHEIVVWGIHAGRTGDAESLFLKQHRIAIGWDEMGDLNELNPMANTTFVLLAAANWRI